MEKKDGEPHRSLATSSRPNCRITLRVCRDQRDRAQEVVDKFKAELDDYNAIMAEALADRLAEAFAECLHKRVRAEWGYGAAKNLSTDDLIEEKYRGIRPRPAIRVSGSHGEGDAVAVARVENKRDQADRIVCHVAGSERQRTLFCPSGSRYSGSAR